MKLSALSSVVIFLSSTVSTVSANPVQQDTTCALISSGSEGCDFDPFHGQRRETLKKGLFIQPNCAIASGRNAAWSKRWAWIQARGCWVTEGVLNVGCVDVLPTCDGLGSDG
ncbi:unnamed protein product [Periconia digitata]|uniref:Uncharacterized protein n=1 Tax=Periconia digitata TaxID=1303443 RepID=A0A9W4U807_9PLEO|nr:unnamed protein product [Periconia digitata]